MVMDTLPKLLLANAQKWGHRRPAIREKEYGIWQTQSWAAYAENVRDLALGLAALGFQRGDKLAIMGVNRPEMYWAMLAAQSLGGVPVPLFHDALPAEVQHLLDHCEAKIVLAETQEQVDKVLAVREGLPKLERLIYDDPRGMRKYTDPILIALAKVQEMGRQFREQQPHYFEQQVEATRPDDVAIISYRYDMAGVARGVMLTHRNLLVAGGGAQGRLHHQHTRGAGHPAARPAGDRTHVAGGAAARLGEPAGHHTGARGGRRYRQEVPLQLLPGPGPADGGAALGRALALPLAESPL
jgi:long-subunit acyl-CoA synthetase (AMP-forming)